MKIPTLLWKSQFCTKFPSVSWMPRFFAWWYKHFYKTWNTPSPFTIFFSVHNFFCAKTFSAFILQKNQWKKKNVIFGEAVGNLMLPIILISGPYAPLWMNVPKLYHDSNWVKIAIFVKFWLLLRDRLARGIADVQTGWRAS